MRAGIFAAGFGSRLAGANGRPKALTPVNGRRLIDWILDDLVSAGVTDVVMIINEGSTAVREHVERGHGSLSVHWIVETTPSSMHSFLRVTETLAAGGDEGPFVVSTVDTIAPRGTFRMFRDRCDRMDPADVILALTTLDADDNPLRVDIAPAAARDGGPVRAIGTGEYVTAGYFMVRSTVLREADRAREANLGALRHYLRRLFEGGYRLAGIVMPDSIDVDRPSDIAAAERLLRSAPA